MPITHIVILALIQGFTEFLPVSSSAHLIIPSQLFNWPDQGIAFDVAVHAGTLLAVVFYYLNDISIISLRTLESLIKRRHTAESRLGWYIILATIPAVVAGFMLQDFIATTARSIEVIAYSTIGFGLLLGIASFINRKINWHTIVRLDGERADSLKNLGLVQALIIGFAQAIALIPGTSRSGITLTAGLLLGLRPEAAARFSFLLSIPVIAGSALLLGYKVLTSDMAGANISEMLIGVVLSFVTALLVIHLFMKYISKSGMALFVIYRLLLGIFLLYFFVWN